MTRIDRLLATTAILALGACAEGTPQGSGNPLDAGRAGYLGDGSDACLAERTRLEEYGREIKSPVDRLLDAGFVVGGVLDSLRQTGRIGGTISGGNVTLAGGYIDALRRENGTVLALLQDATRDIADENRRIDGVIAAFDAITACRQAGAAAIRADYQAGRTGREAAEAAMADLRRAYRADIARAREILDQISTNTETYADVYNDIAEDNEVDALELGPYRKTEFEAGKSSARVVTKRSSAKRATPKGSLTAEAPKPQVRPEVERMQNELLTNVRKRDTVINRIESAERETDGLDLAFLGPRTRHA